jgi:DNA-binding transcriptional ArsR family regulator
LAGHEQITVTELGVRLRLSQPLISWHLRLLRKAGIVTTRRSGRQVWCSLNREALRDYEYRVDTILGHAESDSTDDAEAAAPLALKSARNP